MEYALGVALFMAPRSVLKKEGNAALGSLRGCVHGLKSKPCLLVQGQADGGTNQVAHTKMLCIFDPISSFWAAGLLTGVL